MSAQLMYSDVGVTRKTLAGAEVIAVLSQMIPARVRLINVFLASLVKLPFSFLWVKKNLSPSLVLTN